MRIEDGSLPCPFFLVLSSALVLVKVFACTFFGLVRVKTTHLEAIIAF